MGLKSALVIGASRGIGRQIAITLAENGYNVGVAAKSTVDSDTSPGTIYTVSDEINRGPHVRQTCGGDLHTWCGRALPIQCNCREPADIENAVKECITQFGTLDYAIYNAGAIIWNEVINTPLKRFDLMHEVNLRGAYVMIQSVLPHFLQQKSGRILLVSPPIYNRFFKGKTPYAATKVGMTVLVHGLANELKDTGVSITALWPATVIQSQVTVKMSTPAQYMRKPTIFADACLRIDQDTTDNVNGKALLDEDYLRSVGVADFSQYRCSPDTEPPRMMPRAFPSLLVEEEDQQLNMLNTPPNNTPASNTPADNIPANNTPANKAKL